MHQSSLAVQVCDPHSPFLGFLTDIKKQQLLCNSSSSLPGLLDQEYFGLLSSLLIYFALMLSLHFSFSSLLDFKIEIFCSLVLFKPTFPPPILYQGTIFWSQLYLKRKSLLHEITYGLNIRRESYYFFDNSGCNAQKGQTFPRRLKYHLFFYSYHYFI